MRTLLCDFTIALPQFDGSHDQTVKWLAAAHAASQKALQGGVDFDESAFRRQMERHIRRFGPSAEAVGHRRSDCDEFLDENFPAKKLFPVHTHPSGAGMGVRMDVFASFAQRAVNELFERDSSIPSDILHVTCTGYDAPSAVQRLAVARGWQAQTRITHLYHMGCYASLPALRLARGLIASGSKSCDIVHTEICTLHLNPARHEAEQLVVQSLFADGYIRWRLKPWEKEAKGFEVLATSERLIPDSIDDIGWIPGEFGMRMTLSRHVPDKIANELEPCLMGLAQAAGVRRESLCEATYAIHPGGPRIVDKIAEWLDLKPWQVQASRAVLYARGNMSSATLPHIWAALNGEYTPRGTGQALVEISQPLSKSLVVSLAFGPGLTLYASLMRVQ